MRSRPFALLLLATLTLAMRSHSLPATSVSPRMQHLPRLTLWAWERREDLHSIDPATTAVAALDRTVYVSGEVVRSEPQRNSLLLPGSSRLTRIAVVRIAVVRIEVRAGSPLTQATAEMVADEAVRAAAASGTAALQIDFDATRSQREWYRLLLNRLRAKLPAQMPLSITALASWCSRDRWMTGLPIDEAVPMMFRMEPDRVRAAAQAGTLHEAFTETFALSEPLCRGAVGISTQEAWPSSLQGRRVYLFPDRGWGRDDVAQSVRKIGYLR